MNLISYTCSSVIGTSASRVLCRPFGRSPTLKIKMLPTYAFASFYGTAYLVLTVLLSHISIATVVCSADSAFSFTRWDEINWIFAAAFPRHDEEKWMIFDYAVIRFQLGLLAACGSRNDANGGVKVEVRGVRPLCRTLIKCTITGKFLKGTKFWRNNLTLGISSL